MDPFTRIAELEGLLKDAHTEVEKLRHDCVSGLIGRQTFEELLQATFVPRRADDGFIGIIMCDIDHFKDVNDEHGHRIGDEVIGIVAQAIKGCVRSTDHVARYGGEEYVSIVARTSVAGLAHLSERIRAAVEEVEHPGCPKVTISVGFSLQREEDESPWDVVERADQALYVAKNSGRNRVGHETLGPRELHMIERIERLRRNKTNE
jgi:diguanylate cyclase (GGDEF)-like protein